MEVEKSGPGLDVDLTTRRPREVTYRLPALLGETNDVPVVGLSDEALGLIEAYYMSQFLMLTVDKGTPRERRFTQLPLPLLIQRAKVNYGETQVTPDEFRVANRVAFSPLPKLND